MELNLDQISPVQDVNLQIDRGEDPYTIEHTGTHLFEIHKITQILIQNNRNFDKNLYEIYNSFDRKLFTKLQKTVQNDINLSLK
jgi:hypothetical protein